jgi:hypothetical protein
MVIDGSTCPFCEFTDAQMLENAMLDVAPDEAMDMNKKRKMMRWDAKKRKFVKVSTRHWCCYDNIWRM